MYKDKADGISNDGVNDLDIPPFIRERQDY